MLAARDLADKFEGVAPGSAESARYLAAFQQAVPYLGLARQVSRHAFWLISWLVRMTKPLDWERGSRPIVRPSTQLQVARLGLSPSNVRVLNQGLYEAGLFVMRDSDSGQRYGHRCPDGRIVEAYGFDLSPLAVRYDEFVGLAAEAEKNQEERLALRKRANIEAKERDRVLKLRKRARVLCRTIRKVGQILRAIGTPPSAWTDLESSVAELVAQLSRRCPSGQLALVVAALESRLSEAEALKGARSGIVSR